MEGYYLGARAMIIRDKKQARLLAQEETILEASEAIWEKALATKLNKDKLARRLGRTPAFVTQTLDGTRNMTLRTLADYAHIMNCKVRITLEEI